MIGRDPTSDSVVPACVLEKKAVKSMKQKKIYNYIVKWQCALGKRRTQHNTPGKKKKKQLSNCVRVSLHIKTFNSNPYNYFLLNAEIVFLFCASKHFNAYELNQIQTAKSRKNRISLVLCFTIKKCFGFLSN